MSLLSLLLESWTTVYSSGINLREANYKKLSMDRTSGMRIFLAIRQWSVNTKENWGWTSY
jgi:hypothetical protein